ncbi:ABC transporter permease [Rugosimonospora africana]|uniref:Membrane protein n=1 Tax=Rugosimonospora africana TaxID=556532 RepID=A0A8J3QYF0_9ACTN|nr:ABC transporter permease [Rugosimonospora africana]GIH19534.1 membrane protein [Rugosimonospora africana]
MFLLLYLRRELRRRLRQTVVIALGLAVGIGLVVTITAATAGVRNAQAAVLHALYGIGTDITITMEPPPPPKPGSPQASDFGLTPGAKDQQLDLLGLPPGLGLLDEASVASVARLRGVTAAAGGLSLVDQKLTVPSAASLGPGGKPPASAFPTTSTVDGVDLTHPHLGPFASAQVGSGRSLTATDAGSNVAAVDSSYAATKGLTVGSTIIIGYTKFSVVGIVRQPRGGGSSDIYIPLARAQALAKFKGLANLNDKVDTIYVAAANASTIDAVQKEIATLLPSATVTSSASLANAVTGSLAGAASLANQLGRWLAIVALIAAFAVASLLTVAAVARRVREFGTLKALGWRSSRVVAQVMSESIVTGILGAVAGVAMAFGGVSVINTLAPTLSATVAQNPGSAPPQNVSLNDSGMHRQVAQGATHTVAVHMTAPVTVTAIVLAIILAIAGGLIAGSFGGWRAARLRPVEALGRVE